MENKELQALDKMCEQIDKIGTIAIKNALMPFEIAKDIDAIMKNIKSIKNALIRLEKLEKAIEIDKTKKVSLIILGYAKSVIQYNKCIGLSRIKLTEEEFNILKEVFGNER